jgi:hypothetical protein
MKDGLTMLIANDGVQQTKRCQGWLETSLALLVLEPLPTRLALFVFHISVFHITDGRGREWRRIGCRSRVLRPTPLADPRAWVLRPVGLVLFCVWSL